MLMLAYKTIWVIAVGLPLRAAGPMSPVATELFSVCVGGIFADLIAIPWLYVWANYVRAPGDRWR